MKINWGKVPTTLLGNGIFAQLDGPPLTLRDICLYAVLNSDIRGLDLEAKMVRYQFGKKIKEADANTDFEQSELDAIEQFVGGMDMFGPAVIGVLCEEFRSQND